MCRRGGDRDLGLAGQAEHLLRWLDVLGIEAPILVGHDLGGGVAINELVADCVGASARVAARVTYGGSAPSVSASDRWNDRRRRSASSSTSWPRVRSARLIAR